MINQLEKSVYVKNQSLYLIQGPSKLMNTIWAHVFYPCEMIIFNP